MENFLKTYVAPDSKEASSNKLELLPLDVSNNEKIVVGKNTLTYKEQEATKPALRVIRRVEELKKINILPEDMVFQDNYLVNDTDQGHFISLKTKEGSDYFVKFRSLQVGGMSQSLQEFETVATSLCIFGFGATKARFTDGHSEIFRNGELISDNTDQSSPIVGWNIESKLSAYELETIYRSVSFINALSSENTKYNKVTLNTPLVEYYLVGLDVYANGRLSKKLLLEWFSNVDAKTNRLNKLIEDRLNSNYSVEFRSPLEEIKSYLVSQIESNIVPVFSEALDILRKDKLWEEVLSVKIPKSWTDLVEIAIAVEELRNCFESGEGTTIVKSPKQETTAYISREIAILLNKKYGHSFNLLAMYPHERVVVTHDSPARPLLSHVPEQISTTSAKKIISQYNLKKNDK